MCVCVFPWKQGYGLVGASTIPVEVLEFIFKQKWLSLYYVYLIQLLLIENMSDKKLQMAQTLSALGLLDVEVERKVKIRRNFKWVKSWILQRQAQGAFPNLCGELEINTFLLSSFLLSWCVLICWRNVSVQSEWSLSLTCSSGSASSIGRKATDRGLTRANVWKNKDHRRSPVARHWLIADRRPGVSQSIGIRLISLIF